MPLDRTFLWSSLRPVDPRTGCLIYLWFRGKNWCAEMRQSPSAGYRNDVLCRCWMWCGVRPDVLIGVSGQTGLFTLRGSSAGCISIALAKSSCRSHNPTSRVGGHAAGHYRTGRKAARWWRPAVHSRRSSGRSGIYPIAQCNNAYIFFHGIGHRGYRFGTSRITDEDGC